MTGMEERNFLIREGWALVNGKATNLVEEEWLYLVRGVEFADVQSRAVERLVLSLSQKTLDHQISKVVSI
ncbi:hypothetical protein GW944_00440 [Candidatus Parcubacteria bacterium]|nr:hypothetical protein [Candidatus Parcubacteria bacterium]